jgi:hypothetical protein
LFSSIRIDVFVSDLPSRIHDFGVNPTPSRQASGKLFWVARNISGCPKHNLLLPLGNEFSFVKLCFDLQPHSSASGLPLLDIHFVLDGKVMTVYVAVK